MEYTAAHGYPVPQVHEVRAGGTEIVMERLDGPMLMQTMSTRPHTMLRSMKLLADLHDQLHEIAAPEWLSPLDDGGDRLVHLDLHPMNVMMTTRGPVVIDWTNAARGAALDRCRDDVRLVDVPRVPGPAALRVALQLPRLWIARAFMARYRDPVIDQRVAEAAELKMLDPNMRPDEVDRCRRLADRRRRRRRVSTGRTD